jgi:hypothetical protein
MRDGETILAVQHSTERSTISRNISKKLEMRNCSLFAANMLADFITKASSKKETKNLPNSDHYRQKWSDEFGGARETPGATG